MTAYELALALLRTTLATAAAACLAALLLAVLRINSPRTHRIAWALVVLQGWLLFPWTLTLESPASPQPIAAHETPMPSQAWSEQLSTAPRHQPTDALPRERPLRIADLRGPAACVWIAGAVAVALAGAWRYARILRTLPLGAAPDNPQWQAEWRRARRAHTIRRPARVNLRITDCLGPLLAFVPWRYLILAPRTLWTALAASEREAILRHELAHLRRHDLWKSLAIRALALPQWFNPLVWLAVRRFDEAAEWACDAAAACGLARESNENAPLTLANALLRTAELCPANAPPTTLGFRAAIPANRHRSNLTRRIQRLVTPRFKKESNMKRLAVPVLLAGIAAAQLIRIERVAAEDSPEFPIAAALGEIVDAARDYPSVEPPMSVAEWMAQPRVAATPQNNAAAPIAPAPAPREFKKVTLPTYVVEPPDILAVQCVSLIPNESYVPNPQDLVHVTITGGGNRPNVDGNFQIAVDGAINLGKLYGQVHLAGRPVLFLKQYNNIAPVRILERQLTKELGVEKVSIAVVTTVTKSEVAGQHLVAMDGCVNLGVYGSVFVAGMTIDETRLAIEKKLREKADVAEVSVDVLGYNSKVYYIITQGGAQGDDVVRASITGNETVLDAIANIGGVPAGGNVRIWIARPAPNGVGAEQILPVVWDKIARGESTETNYQLLPGDRLFIEPKQQAAETKRPAAAAATAAAPVVPPEAVFSAAYDAPASNDVEPPAKAPQSQRIVFFSLRMPDGKGVEWPVEYAAGTTIGEVLKNTTYPNPVDFDRAIITLSRHSRVRRDGSVTEVLTTWPVGWDAAAGSQVAPDDALLKPGDRISIDLSPPPATPAIQPNRTPDSAAAPAPRVGELQVHDVVTVLVGYGAKAKDRHPQSFRIPCEITEIRANGNLCIEGRASIRNADEWWETSLSGEVRRETVGPDGTVSSDSIVNLDIHKRVVRSEPVFSFNLGFARSGGVRSGSPPAAPAVTPSPAPDAVPPPAAAPLAPPAAVPAASGPIEYKLAILDDLSGDLGEFLGPQNDTGVAILKTNVLEPSLRVLTKHKLIKHLGDPRIRTQIDRPAEFNLASKSVAGIDRAFTATQRVKILGHHAGQGAHGRSLIVNVEAMATHDEKRYRVEAAFTIAEGETALVKLRTSEGEKSGPLYLALTPEWVE